MRVIIHNANNYFGTWEALKWTYGQFMKDGYQDCAYTWSFNNGDKIAVVAYRNKKSITLRVQPKEKE
jgi:hypothetical protein